MSNELVDLWCLEVFSFLKEFFAFLPVKLINFSLYLYFLHIFEFDSI